MREEWKKASLTVLATVGLTVGAAAALTPAHADTGVTAMINLGSPPTYQATRTIYAGPSKAYPNAGVAARDTTYAVLCTTAAGARKAGEAGPIASTGDDGAWDRIAATSSPDAPIGYLPDTDLILSRGGDLTDWTSLPACPAPPPLPEGTPQHPVVRAPQPGTDALRTCGHGVLQPGPSQIAFSSEQTIDVEFSSASLGVNGIDVTDPGTGHEDSGNALPQIAATPHGPTSWHFKETANGVGVTPHVLNVIVSGAISGKNGEKSIGEPTGGFLGANDGGPAADSIEGDVAWVARSISCG